MYELLVGKRPFEADTEVGILFKILNEKPNFNKNPKRQVPGFLQKIILKAMEKDLDKRYKNGLELASDLSTAFDHVRFMGEEIHYDLKLNILKDLDFFRDFNENELAEVINVTRWISYRENSIIITEGEIEDCFYIVATGELQVLKKGNSMALLKKGDCFGEMAYLGKMSRTATIKALKKANLIKINTSAIERLSVNTRLRFYQVFTKTLILRLDRTSKLLLAK